MIHVSERLYKCTLCAETYSSKKKFDVHIKTHSLSSTIRQSTSSQQQQQYNSAAAVISSAPTLSRVTSNPCGISNGMVNSMSDSLNSSFHNSNVDAGGTHRQLLSSGSIVLGRAAAVNQANGANGFLPIDCQNNQHQNGLNNGSSKTFHHGSNLANSRPIPPLIPITVGQSTTLTISNVTYSQPYGCEYFNRRQQFIASSSPQKFLEEREFEVGGQGRSSLGEKMMDQQALRSTSVIRFSHRPAGDSSL